MIASLAEPLWLKLWADPIIAHALQIRLNTAEHTGTVYLVDCWHERIAVLPAFPLLLTVFFVGVWRSRIFVILKKG